MNIAITGATGFIGKYLCRELVAKNRLNILTRDVRNATLQLPYDNINLLDLSLLESRLRKELKDTEVLIHMAGNRFLNIRTEKGLEPYFSFLNLTDKIMNLLPVEKHIRVINISSKSVYGVKNVLPYHEFQIPKPTGFYGLSKLTAEQQFDIYGLKSNYSVIHLRIGQVIGWGDSYKNNFVTFLNNALNKKTQKIWGNGEETRSYIYAKDVVNTIIKVIAGDETGPFNLAWPNAICHLELAKSINKVFGNDRIAFLADKPSDTKSGEMDISKAEKVLNWFPEYRSLETALMDMKKDYEEKNLYWL